MGAGEGARQPQVDTAWRRQLYEGIGKAINKKRNEANLSVRTVADRLGITYSMVSRIESGENAPTHFLVKFAALVKCEVSDLIPKIPVTFLRIVEKGE